MYAKDVPMGTIVTIKATSPCGGHQIYNGKRMRRMEYLGYPKGIRRDDNRIGFMFVNASDHGAANRAGNWTASREYAWAIDEDAIVIADGEEDSSIEKDGVYYFT